MHMKLQKFKQNTIRFVVTHFLHIALVIIAFMVVKYFEPIGIAQIDLIREIIVISTLVAIF